MKPLHAGIAFVLALAAPIASAQESPPSILLGDLFTTVQSRRLFQDSKTFADAVPRRPVAEILADWRHERPRDDTALRALVAANFEVPPKARRLRRLPPSARPSPITSTRSGRC